MYVRAVFLGFGCIECLVARLSKLAFGYTVTYSPELQKAGSKDVSAMASLAVATRRTYVDRESLHHALTSDLVGWTVSETREAPLLTHVVSHRLGDIRLVELSGNPFGAVRGRAEISGDSDTYLGILYQRSGSTLCRRGDDRVIVGPGEICVWHSGRPVSFEMPEKFDKLCMIVPIARFESVLYNAETYEGLRLPAAVTWPRFWVPTCRH